MNEVVKDKYGFIVGTQTNKIAAIIDKGGDAEAIIKAGFTRQQAHAARWQMKKAGATLPDWPRAASVRNITPNVRGANVNPRVLFTPQRLSKDGNDKYGFRNGSKKSRAATFIEAGKLSAVEIAASVGCVVSIVHSTRGEMRKRGWNEKGAGTQLTLRPPHPTPAALPKRKGNGADHAPRGFEGADVTVVEAIVHPLDGQTIRIFSSVDLFPAIFRRVQKITGIT